MTIGVAYYMRHTLEVTPAADPHYKGVPLGDLEVEEVYWSEKAAHHIQFRSERKLDQHEVNIEPEWATEAVFDPNRRLSVSPNNQPGKESLIVIGMSPSMGRVLKVWLYAEDPRQSLWNGASAAVASDRLARRYQQSIEREADGE